MNLIDFSTKDKIVMGILNVTENSFYDGKRYKTESQILKRVTKMLEEGASIIDVGVQSSKPGSKQIKDYEELKKILPIIKLLKKNFNKITISVDTFWSKVANECVNAGANIINDISAGSIDDKMLTTVAKLNVPYVLMHMKGNPRNMQKDPKYKNVTNEILYFFKQKITHLHKKGISKIILDPGIGFGKTIEHNYELINNIKTFQQLNYPILIGASRKSMIYNALNTTAEKALNGTTIINTIALNNGANILRVHDVKEAIECIKITNLAKNKY